MQMLRRRTMMGKSGGGGLPSGYTAYDWVQADSTTGIGAVNTGFILDLPRATTQKRYTIETAFARTEDFAANWKLRIILGNSADTYDEAILLSKAGNTVDKIGFRYQCYNGSTFGSITDFAINIGEWHHVVLTYKDEDEIGGKLILDGTTHLVTAYAGNATRTKPLYLMGLPNAEHEVYPCRMARTKIYDYGVLAADLIPAMRDADSVVGFYDVVRNTFYAPTTEGVTLLCGYGFDNFNA